jgi:hypothetical protein
MVMKLRLQNIGKFLSGKETVGFSRRAQLHGINFGDYKRKLQRERCRSVDGSEAMI